MNKSTQTKINNELVIYSLRNVFLRIEKYSEVFSKKLKNIVNKGIDTIKAMIIELI